MKFTEKIYNYDNLTSDAIDETTTRARAIIINSNREVLMCYSNGLQHYEFPGGHLEKNETLEESLKREILEETGITIDLEKVKPFYTIKYYCKNYHNSGKNRLVEIFTFRLTDVNDLITNTLGTTIGYLLYTKVLNKILQTKK